MPNMISELETNDGPVKLDDCLMSTIMTSYWPSTHDAPAMHGAASQIINLTYDLLYYLNEKLNGSRYEISECYLVGLCGVPNCVVPWPLAHILDFASFFGRWGFVQSHISKGSNSTHEDVERVVSAAILGLGHTVEWSIKIENFMNQFKGVSDILLEFLPKSTNTIMYPYTAAIKHQFGNHSKWTILFVWVSHLISTTTVPGRYGNKLEIFGLCKQIIKTLMKHDARADINMLLNYSFRITLGDQERKSLRMVVKETLLACVKRRLSRDPDLLMDMENFLYDLGATDHRIFHSVDGLPLTHSQSERLSHILSHERLRYYSVYVYSEDEVIIELGKVDAMPIEPNPQAEDIVQSIESQAW